MAVYKKFKENIWKVFIRRISEVGVWNALVGSLKKMKYRRLIKKYHFNEWHLNPYEWKEYAQVCVGYVNTQSCRTVVDIGCGLGEILQHIKADKKIGFDLRKEVIMAAHELSGQEIEFKVGSFGELTEKSVDYLITLNFMHGRSESEWAEIYRTVAVCNDVQHFIVDTVPDKAFSPTTHSLDWSKILPDNYKRIERFGPLFSGRYVEVWEKQ